jgi:hypothetical protein
LILWSFGVVSFNVLYGIEKYLIDVFVFFVFSIVFCFLFPFHIFLRTLFYHIFIFYFFCFPIFRIICVASYFASQFVCTGWLLPVLEFTSFVAPTSPAGLPASLHVDWVEAAVLADVPPACGISLVVHLAGVDTRPWEADTLVPAAFALTSCLCSKALVAAVCVLLSSVFVAAFPRYCQRSTFSVSTIFVSST